MGARRIVVVGAGSGIGAAGAAHFHNRGDYVLAVDVRPNDTPASRHAQVRSARPAQHRRHCWTARNRVGHARARAGVPGTAPADDVLTVNYLGMRLMVEGMLPSHAPRRCGGGRRVDRRNRLGAAPRRTLPNCSPPPTPRPSPQWQARQDPVLSGVHVVQTGGDPLRQAVGRYGAVPSYGVRVNTVSPGPVQTPILADFEQTMGRSPGHGARRPTAGTAPSRTSCR